jgi:hypothetical protein
MVNRNVFLQRFIEIIGVALPEKISTTAAYVSNFFVAWSGRNSQGLTLKFMHHDRNECPVGPRAFL